MFNKSFYPRFDEKYQHGFIMYSNGSPIYGKEIQDILKSVYKKNISDCYKLFSIDLNNAYREYAEVCYIPILYDSFTDEMKEFIENNNNIYYLCDIQKMTRKELFMLFDGADINLLYNVASFIFTYCDEKNDSNTVFICTPDDESF